MEEFLEQENLNKIFLNLPHSISWLKSQTTKDWIIINILSQEFISSESNLDLEIKKATLKIKNIISSHYEIITNSNKYIIEYYFIFENKNNYNFCGYLVFGDIEIMH